MTGRCIPTFMYISCILWSTKTLYERDREIFYIYILTGREQTEKKHTIITTNEKKKLFIIINKNKKNPSNHVDKLFFFFLFLNKDSIPSMQRINPARLESNNLLHFQADYTHHQLIPCLLCLLCRAGNLWLCRGFRHRLGWWEDMD